MLAVGHGDRWRQGADFGITSLLRCCIGAARLAGISGRLGHRQSRAGAGRGAQGRRASLRCASLSLPCDARTHGPSRNSLRSLRSLRSDNRDESVHEARCRARPWALRFSAPLMRAPASPSPPLPGSVGMPTVARRHLSFRLKQRGGYSRLELATLLARDRAEHQRGGRWKPGARQTVSAKAGWGWSGRA
jgi:hypothetical protein